MILSNYDLILFYFHFILSYPVLSYLISSYLILSYRYIVGQNVPCLPQARVPSWLPSLQNTWALLAYTHYDDVVMGTMASQITSLTSVYSTVYSGADQRKMASNAEFFFIWWRHHELMPLVLLTWRSKAPGHAANISQNIQVSALVRLKYFNRTYFWYFPYINAPKGVKRE